MTETATPVTETEVQVTLCAATTKKGLPCKNRPQHGGTLCGPHGKQATMNLADELFAPDDTWDDQVANLASLDEPPGLRLDPAALDIEPVNDIGPPLSKHDPVSAQPEIVCISGSQDNDYPEATCAVLDSILGTIHPRPYIILGNAKGTDRMVAKYLKAEGYKVEVSKPRWETPGGTFRPSAGMENNEEMIRRADRLIAFNHEGVGNGSSMMHEPKSRKLEAVDKGTTQAIEKAQDAHLQISIVNLSKWEADDASNILPTHLKQLPEIRRDQVVPASEFAYTPSRITLNTSSWIYIGRGKHGTAMQHPGMLALPRKTTHADFKRRIWQRMTKRDVHLLRELARITGTTTLICDCNPRDDKHTCHAPIVIGATNFLLSDDGRKYRMTSREIKDYDAIHHPAYLSTMTPPDRVRIVSRYVKMIQTPGPKPRNMNGSKKLSNAKPLVKNSRVIYINGDLELPAIITHIEYGDRWIDDAYTGRRRLEIINCLLVNEAAQANFVYSDSNAEMIRRGHRNTETGLPSELGLLPTIAPYIRKVKVVKEVVLTELTKNNRIKSGMTIRILDRTTNEVMDIGIAKAVQSAMWYKVVPQAPAIKDAWIVEYLSLLTNKVVTWKGDEGTRIETAY